MTQRTKGKPSTRPAAIPEVESRPCPSGGNHRLANTRAGRTRCAGCGESWAALDAELRKP